MLKNACKPLACIYIEPIVTIKN